MRKQFYLVSPIVGFVLVLLKAIFGYMIFDAAYEQDITKYAIYVHFYPDWKSYPGNILFEITNVWSNSEDSANIQNFSMKSLDISPTNDYNSNQLQMQHQKSFVELKHDFSGCTANWKPISYVFAVDYLRNYIELIQGTTKSADPYVQTLPNLENENYDLTHQNKLVQSGYVQFIPICTTQENTTYEYSISSNDKDIGFDAFFVPSKNELRNYLNSNSFEFYTQEGCSVQNHKKFSGICSDVNKNSGLLIIIPDEIKSSLTTIKINLHELEHPNLKS